MKIKNFYMTITTTLVLYSRHFLYIYVTYIYIFNADYHINLAFTAISYSAYIHSYSHSYTISEFLNLYTFSHAHKLIRCLYAACTSLF